VTRPGTSTTDAERAYSEAEATEEEATEEEKESTDYTDYRITQIREEAWEETEEATAEEESAGMNADIRR
jgi:hypothetical protein